MACAAPQRPAACLLLAAFSGAPAVLPATRALQGASPGAPAHHGDGSLRAGEHRLRGTAARLAEDARHPAGCQPRRAACSPQLPGQPRPSAVGTLPALPRCPSTDLLSLPACLPASRLGVQRLETLGDAFLKFAVSAQLFSAHRQYHEGQLTKRKELVVANIHLAEAAVKVCVCACVCVCVCVCVCARARDDRHSATKRMWQACGRRVKEELAESWLTG